MRRWMALGLLMLLGCGGRPAPATLTLDRVVLFQNGIGYFERHGTVRGSAARMRFAPYEINDVLKTVTVIDDDAASVANVEVEEPDPPARAAKEAREEANEQASGEAPAAAATATARTTTTATTTVTLRLSTAGLHRLHVSYAVPTPIWKASYRVVLDEPGASARPGGLLQGWATINNTSGEDWTGVRLSLAAGAPFSYAMDLSAPTYVSRPDLNGVMVAPTVTSAVAAEQAGGGTTDTDGDGLKNRDDLCPREREDRDDYEDADGCPDPDNDLDRVLDGKDRCPNEPETYNGFEDEDGCPDRGRVVVTDSAVEILDNIYFKKGSAALTPDSLPIVEAIAQTLLGNADLQLLEVQGHTSDDEARGWDLSAERSAAIIMALRERGVEGSRLAPQGYAATQPIDRSGTERARAKNRRGGFLILRRGDAPGAARAGAITVAKAERSVHAETIAVEVAGASRYEFAAPMTIPRGGATMVSIINQPVDAEDIYLFRPDPAASGSDRHPFRAIRLHNSSKFTLQPGAVAVFARQTYVGDSLLSSLPPEATTFAPYAVDAAATVSSEASSDELPLRIVSASRGSITVEVARRQLTRYEITPSATPPARLFLRHPKAVGYRVEALPPDSVDQGESWLVAVPLSPGKDSTVVVEERLPEHHTYELTARQLPDLTAYLAGSHVPDVAATALRAAIAQRVVLRKLDDDLDELRARYNDALDRVTEVRASLAALGTSAEGAGLRKQLVAELATGTAAMNSLTRELAQKTREQVTAETKLRDLVRSLVIAEPR